MVVYWSAGLLGLLVGSFLNVAISRLPRGESLVLPGSYCPKCYCRLGIADLIPVFSYLLRRGHCHYCEEPIIWRYPLVEIFTAAAFMVVFDQWGLTQTGLIGWIFTSILIVAACTDLETGLIPNRLTYPGMLIGIMMSTKTIGLSNSSLGLVSFSGLLLVIAVMSRGGMGGGDIKLAGVIGAFLGVVGSGITLMLASLAGCMWSLWLLLQGKCGRKTSIPFGPHLSVSAWLVWVYGEQLLLVYWGFVSWCAEILGHF